MTGKELTQQELLQQHSKPDVDEIFLGDKNITGRTAYEDAEVNIRKSKADQDVQTIIAKPITLQIKTTQE